MKMKTKALPLYILIALSAFFACTDEAPTISVTPVTETSPEVTSGSLYPQIQKVYPGGLQSLDIPETVPSGISPNNPGIAVVFTHTMENSADEMDTNIVLLQGATPVAKTVTPTTTDSKVFTITPSAALSQSTTYTIRINNTAQVNDSTSRTLTYDNLETPPTTNLSPASPTYVDYQFQTGTITPADTTDPTLTSTSPADTAVGVAVDLSGGYNGYIEIVFNDNSTPMIDPSTVTTDSVTLEAPGPVTGRVEIDVSDTDIKTFRFYPDGILAGGTVHTLTVSVVGNVITDFANPANTMTQTSISFTTAAVGAPTIDNYVIESVSDDSVTIKWATDIESIKHLDIEAVAAALPSYDGGTLDVHDTTLAWDFTHTLGAGLTSNTLYSFMISADTDTTKIGTVAFDTNQTVTDAFRTYPDTGDNYQLAVANTAKSSLQSIQISQDNSFIIWRDTTNTDIMAQYMDTSAGAAGTWDKWPNTTNNTGVQIFTSDGTLETIEGPNDRVIALRENAGIFAASFYDNGGTRTYDWGDGGGATTPGAGDTVYNAATSNARMAVSYSAYVTDEVTDGTHTAELDYIYDTAAGFAAVAAGDHVINETSGTHFTVATNVDNSFLELNGVVITNANRDYRIGDDPALTPNNVLAGSNIDDSGPATFTPGSFDVNGQNIVVSGTANYGMNALAGVINTAGAGNNFTCSAVTPGTGASYLVITETNAGNIVIDNVQTILNGSTINDVGGATFPTGGQLEVNGIAITVNSAATYGMTALAGDINTAGSGNNFTCSAQGAGTATAYLQITETNGGNIVITNTSSNLAEFGLSLGTTSLLDKFGLTTGTTQALTMSSVSGNDFESSSDFSVGDVIANTLWGYVTAKAGANAPWTYTINIDIGIANGQTFTVYDFITNGTVETEILYDDGINFSTLGGGIAANDIVINLSSGESDKVASIYTGNEALVLSNGAQFIFDTDAENYQILRLTDHNNFVTSGRNTSYAGLTVTQTGATFVTDGALIGDIIYNISTNEYTEITGAAETILTMTSQIFTANSQSFIIFRYKGITFAWTESNNILGKTIDNSDGTRLYPDSAAGTSFTITNAGNNCRNPYIIQDLIGNGIVVYELANGGNWDIKAKKISGDGSLLWADPADNDTDDGIAVATNQSVSTGMLIQDVISDNNGGVWVIYENASPVIGVVHIDTSGSVTSYSIANAENPDVVRYSSTNIVVAYEVFTTVGSDIIKRIYVQRYSNTPAAVGGATHVRSADESYTQINPKVSTDGSDGFIVSWFETKYYPSIYYSIFAQHFDNGMTRVYGDDAFVAIPVKDDQSDDPYAIEHGIIRYNDGAAPNAGIFFWLDERSANPTDIYFQNLSD